mgnify:FL=1
MAKKWLFWFCEGSVCVSGQNQMCRLCGCLKLFLKNAGRQKKIKKHWGGLSVGLLAVPFQYGLYVFGHLSKWFVFVLMFKFWSVYRLWNGRPTIGYNLFIPATAGRKITQIFPFSDGLLQLLANHVLQQSFHLRDTIRGKTSIQQPLDRNILIQILPMDPYPIPDQSPIFTFCRRSIF